MRGSGSETNHNNALLVESWNKVWTIHRFNKFQEMANKKLPKVNNLYIELTSRLCCNAVAYPFGANCQAKMISQWMHTWTLTFRWWLSIDDCRSEMSVVCFHFFISISLFLLLEWPILGIGTRLIEDLEHVSCDWRPGTGNEARGVSCPNAVWEQNYGKSTVEWMYVIAMWSIMTI